jgi:CRISPR type III-B/RAMP module RAMP protein Cmr6
MPGVLNNQREMEGTMIPLSRDVAALIGDWAEGVENRSLLHEKYALPKVWGQAPDVKLNDAGRWSVLRIVSRGSELLKGDAQRLRREAGGRNTRPDVVDRKERDAGIAEKISVVARIDPKLVPAANSSARNLLSDITRSFNGRVATFEVTLGARLMVNLAGGVIENAGIALDRCFGLPFIPGSAVKGISRNQALWEIHEAAAGKKPNLLRLAMLLFGYGGHDLKDSLAWAVGSEAAAKAIAAEIGSADFKGCACFLPAYPTTPPTLVVDMVNSHYPDYYGGKVKVAKDNESPRPNYFPAVESGSSFGFAVVLNRVPDVPGIKAGDLLAQVKDWLQNAVTRKGVGAKTAAGYGWFELGAAPAKSEVSTSTPAAKTAVPAPPASPTDTVIQKWRGRLTTKDNFSAALPELLVLADDTELRRAFDAVIPEQERRKNKKGNPYWQSFTSGKHAEAGKKILARLKFTLS